MTALMDRWLEKVEITDGCWLWSAFRNQHGYGMIRDEGRVVRAHRVAYEAFRGPVPKGLELDHLCRNRACVRPSHLEAVSHAVNMRRGAGVAGLNAAKSTCVNGHVFDIANTYVRAAGQRTCRACHRAHERARSMRARGLS